MLNPVVQQGLNDLLNAELYSAYMHFTMSAYFGAANLGGIANWLQKRAGNELDHAREFMDLIVHRQGQVQACDVAAPPSMYSSPVSALDELRRHEERTTGMMNDLMGKAIEACDFPTVAYLLELSKRQVAEESDVTQMCMKVHETCEGPPGLCLLDHELQHHKSHLTQELP